MAHQLISVVNASPQMPPTVPTPAQRAGVGRLGASLSKCHNSTEEISERVLTGSQAKTAFALRTNAARMIEAYGLNRTAFLTLTVGRYINRRTFEQVHDMDEANKRANSLATHLLPLIFTRAIIVTERHKSGAIHYHLLGILKDDVDIRTGFDFEAHQLAIKSRKSRRVNRAAEKAYIASASPALRNLWKILRERLPAYGFGRAELLPIRKTGDAVASYVSKYIEKNVVNRPDSDKGRKLVRYLGWQKAQLKPNDFEWNTEHAQNWRKKIRRLVSLYGLQPWDISEHEHEARVLEYCDATGGQIRPRSSDWSKVKHKFGPRWAYYLSGVLREVWGDSVPNIWFSAKRLVKALRLMDEIAGRYEHEIMEGMRMLKLIHSGEADDIARSQDEARRDWWQIEFSAYGFSQDVLDDHDSWVSEQLSKLCATPTKSFQS